MKILKYSALAFLIMLIVLMLLRITSPTSMDTMNIDELKLDKASLLHAQALSNTINADEGISSIIVCGDDIGRPIFAFLGNKNDFDQGKYITEGFTYIGLHSTTGNDLQVTTISGEKVYDGQYLAFFLFLTGNQVDLGEGHFPRFIPEYRLQLNKQVPYDETNTSVTLESTFITLKYGDCIAVTGK